MKRLFKWLGVLLGLLVVLVIIVVAVIYFASESKFSQTYNVQVDAIAIPSDSLSLAEGQRLYESRGCADCHGIDLGGKVFIDSPAMGFYAGTNLTSGEGGVGGERSTIDLIKAIRHGLSPENEPLLFMPSYDYYFTHDEDMRKMIAYIQNAPPVNRAIPASEPGPISRMLLVSGQMPLLAAAVIDHDAPRPEPVQESATLEFGEYLSYSCIGCHGAGFSGGPMPGLPPGTPEPSNLTPDPQTGLGEWTEADFVKAMREGIRPDGQKLDPFMPWQSFNKMTDTELRALWIYFQSLEPKEYGNR